MDRRWLRAHFVELVIFCFALSLLFIKLGIGEFEDWDESHIVYRAQVIERYGAWLDQSPYALGGLYSSSHPPLGVWMMVASRAIFGQNEFATRLPAALCGLFAAVGMIYLLRRWCSDRLALLMSAAFVSSSLFLWYSRHAQLDSLLIATSVLSLALFIQAIDKRSIRLAWIAGIVFCLALLSKLGWALFILPFVIGSAYQKKQLPFLSRFLIIGVAIGSSWYVYMAATNEAFLSSVFGWLVGLSSVQNYETGERSWTYYINQLILACPFVVAAMIRSIRVKKESDSWIALVWLVIVLIVLQLAVTKFPHFALVLLPPAFVLSAMLLSDLKRLSWVEWSALIVATMWSLSTQFRLFVKGAEFEYIAARWDIAVPLAIALVALIAFQLKQSSRSHVAFTGLVGAIVIVAGTRIIGYPPDLYNDGAKQIASKLLTRPKVTNLIVVHSGAPFDSLTPRLAYYTNGWTSGWVEGRSSEKLAWTDPTLDTKLGALGTINTAVILERERDRFAKPMGQEFASYSPIVALLGRRYQHRDSLRSYDLFYN
jgi:4-amino-4-deoxy-L-arabinose transferase-like glycosyltransferase